MGVNFFFEKMPNWGGGGPRGVWQKTRLFPGFFSSQPSLCIKYKYIYIYNLYIYYSTDQHLTSIGTQSFHCPMNQFTTSNNLKGKHPKIATVHGCDVMTQTNLHLSQTFIAMFLFLGWFRLTTTNTPNYIYPKLIIYLIYFDQF